MSKIEWKTQPKNLDSRVITTFGYINNVLMFEVSQFVQNRRDDFGNTFLYKDHFILTSRIIPMEMLVEENFDSIETKAWGSYKEFIEKIS